MGSIAHILAIPYTAQGHVIHLMELCQCVVKHGLKVTFVNTDVNHKRVMDAMAEKNFSRDGINLVSIPDGLESWEDRNDLRKLSEAILRVVPGKLKELIDRMNTSEEVKISCVIADGSIGWALEVAEELRIRRAVFWSASAAQLSLIFSIPKLQNDGIINSHGTPMKKQMIQLAPRMPAINPEDFSWARLRDFTTQKNAFSTVVRNSKAAKSADRIIYNSANDREPEAFVFLPKISPIGPLLANDRVGVSAGYFWQEDSSCLKWLDQQQPNSVIYVAFGSFAVFDQTQFKELALGLEVCSRPFLWVVRSDIAGDTSAAYPEGFQERVVWTADEWFVGHLNRKCLATPLLPAS